MPDRYHIKVVAMPGRFRRVGKYGSVDWREDCSRCTNCVKHRCIYSVYKHEGEHNREPQSPLEPLNECKACLSCVQGCTKGLLAMSINPDFLGMGDEYWRPDMIATTWNQADTGKIPVSGEGYRGRFSGPGFDGIWTDMSEIVRPTRDGIHGREYISTSVDIGPKPMRLSFNSDGSVMEAPPLMEIQMPVILDVPPWSVKGDTLSKVRAAAAAELKVLAVVPMEHVSAIKSEHLHAVVPLLKEGADLAAMREALKAVRMIEIVDSPDCLSLAAKAKDINPHVVISIRARMTPDIAKRLLVLTQAGIVVFHVCADIHGRQIDVPQPRHIKDAVREIHTTLVAQGVRDKVTLIVGGGVGLPEHMAKTIICGADLIATDAVLMIALGCRLCRLAKGGMAAAACRHEDAPHSDSCPGQIQDDQADYARQRMVNLMGAWHSQLIEVLGAMGIREVRRLRGEVGRAIFMEDMEKEAFNDLVRN